MDFWTIGVYTGKKHQVQLISTEVSWFTAAHSVLAYWRRKGRIDSYLVYINDCIAYLPSLRRSRFLERQKFLRYAKFIRIPRWKDQEGYK